MAILSKARKPDSFELHNSLKLSFTNIQGLCLNFVDCKSFLESNGPNILCVRQNLDDTIDSGNFSVRAYLPLIRKDSSTHMHGLAFDVKKDLLLHKTDLRFLLMFSTDFTSLTVLLLFPLWINFFVVVHSFWLCFI